MKGVIEKVWDKLDRKGGRYLVLQIAGERYSLWDEQRMNGLEEGIVVEYEWKQAGRYKNISTIELDPDYSATHRAQKRDRDVVRMSCLKSAAALLSSADADPEKKGQLTLDLARQFERYVTERDE